ncbi:helix-turn-helix domain-containing protein [Paenibacillus sp. HB172176]|uniref:helix-turn-helix domain-containing protein n=1 Tax=Paenibacillus sp. HB172176 TaxID=2493690 RepID=UPI00143B4C83|nr:helix-turn-helix domain-containing protein [Paenibacillus sp. HB172176]
MMWKRFLVRRKSVILTWLLSYFAILIVPILISMLVYNQSQEILKSEIHRANNVLLKEVREVIDNHVQNAERLTTELMWNVRIRGYMYSSLYTLPDSLDNDLYDLHQTAKEMAIYQSLYTAVKTYYVYWKEQDLVFEPGVYRDSKLAFETIHENETLSYEMWLNLLQDNKSGHFIKLAGRGNSSDALAYIHSFPGDNLEGSPGASVVLLDTSQLMDTLRNVQNFSSGKVLVLNKNNQIVLSTENNENPLFLANMDLPDKSGSYFAEYDGVQSEYMYIKSANSELTYVTVVPSSLLWQKTHHLKKITYVGMLLSLIGGIGLSIVFLLRNYSPIQRLLNLLKSEEKTFVHSEGNEFLHIQNAITTTLNEKGQIQLRMRQQANMLRSNMLARMFKGRLGNQIAIDESLSAFDVRFKSDRFAVILFYMDYEKFDDHLEGIPVADKPWLMQFIVTNIVEEMAGERHIGYVCEMDNNMVCLLNFDAVSEVGLLDDAISLAERARTFLSEKFNIHTLVSVSEIKHSAEEISHAYREAVDALEYLVVIGDRGIVTYEETKSQEADQLQSSYYYPIQVEQQLINYVKAGDARKAEEMIRHIIEKNTGQSHLSVELIKCLMVDLISTLMKTMGEIGDIQESASVMNALPFSEIMNGESIKEMEARIYAVVQEVSDYAMDKQRQQQQSSRNQALEERSAEIILYISENFKDQNLNISMIGEHFSMTPTYLSRLFKDQTGNGLLDTINHYRLQLAKELLQERRDSITSIASQVGFHDVNTFIRVFKKYEGVTPGQYQKAL